MSSSPVCLVDGRKAEYEQIKLVKRLRRQFC